VFWQHAKEKRPKALFKIIKNQRVPVVPVVSLLELATTATAATAAAIRTVDVATPPAAPAVAASAPAGAGAFCAKACEETARAKAAKVKAIFI
jgi:hypothetical protein